MVVLDGSGCFVLCVLCLAAGMSVCVWALVFQHDGIVLLVQRVWEWKQMSLLFWFLIPDDIYVLLPKMQHRILRREY